MSHNIELEDSREHVFDNRTVLIQREDITTKENKKEDKRTENTQKLLLNLNVPIPNLYNIIDESKNFHVSNNEKENISMENHEEKKQLNGITNHNRILNEYINNEVKKEEMKENNKILHFLFKNNEEKNYCINGTIQETNRNNDENNLNRNNLLNGIKNETNTNILNHGKASKKVRKNHDMGMKILEGFNVHNIIPRKNEGEIKFYPGFSRQLGARGRRCVLELIRRVYRKNTLLCKHILNNVMDPPACISNLPFYNIHMLWRLSYELGVFDEAIQIHKMYGQTFGTTHQWCNKPQARIKEYEKKMKDEMKENNEQPINMIRESSNEEKCNKMSTLYENNFIKNINENWDLWKNNSNNYHNMNVMRDRKNIYNQMNSKEEQEEEVDHAIEFKNEISEKENAHEKEKVKEKTKKKENEKEKKTKRKRKLPETYILNEQEKNLYIMNNYPHIDSMMEQRKKEAIKNNCMEKYVQHCMSPNGGYIRNDYVAVVLNQMHQNMEYEKSLKEQGTVHLKKINTNANTITTATTTTTLSNKNKNYLNANTFQKKMTDSKSFSTKENGGQGQRECMNLSDRNRKRTEENFVHYNQNCKYCTKLVEHVKEKQELLNNITEYIQIMNSEEMNQLINFDQCTIENVYAYNMIDKVILHENKNKVVILNVNNKKTYTVVYKDKRTHQNHLCFITAGDKDNTTQVKRSSSQNSLELYNPPKIKKEIEKMEPLFDHTIYDHAISKEKSLEEPSSSKKLTQKKFIEYARQFHSLKKSMLQEEKEKQSKHEMNMEAFQENYYDDVEKIPQANYSFPMNDNMDQINDQALKQKTREITSSLLEDGSLNSNQTIRNCAYQQNSLTSTDSSSTEFTNWEYNTTSFFNLDSNKRRTNKTNNSDQKNALLTKETLEQMSKTITERLIGKKMNTK